MQYLKQLMLTCTYIVLRPVEKNPKLKKTHKVINGNKKYNDFAYCLNIGFSQNKIQLYRLYKIMNGINFFSTFQNYFTTLYN